MKAAILFTAGGPLAVVSNHDSLEDPDLLRRLEVKGIRKFMAFELPIDAVRSAYGSHFTMVMEDYKQADELRVLDEDGGRIFSKFHFSEFGPPVVHDPGVAPPDPAAMI